MNKELKEDDRAIKISMPLLTEKEMLEIDNNFNEIVNKIKNQFIKEKDLAIAQYIINKQQKELQQKESILDKVTDKLKEDISEAKEKKIKYWEEQYRISRAKKDEFYKNSYKRQINRWQSRFETLRGILEFIEGEKK